MIEAISFLSTNPGSHTLVLGSIHGNEVCGSIAIDGVIDQIRNGSIQIISGQVTFLPRANRKAYDNGTREIIYNLNRAFGPREIISEEHRVAKIIEGYINQATFILDLHSIHEGDGAFAFQESPIEVAKSFIAGLPVPRILLDWEKLYRETADMDTIAYATSRGTPGVTVECGNHKDQNSIKVAEESINYALSFFGHTTDIRKDSVIKTKSFVRVKEIVYRPEGARFCKSWKNFDPIQEGELIGTSSQGNHIAPYDGVIIIPKSIGDTGDEWYYLGTIK